jgi:predicted dehydrogenase
MRVVIIGLGSIARKHIAVLREIDPGVEIYALRSGKRSTKVERVTDFYVFEEVEKIAPDFILLSNPTSMREAILTSLLSLGKPLFIEKPVLANLDNAEAIGREIEERNLLTYVACNLRFRGCLSFTRDLLHMSEEQINEVNIYCGSYLPDWRPGADFRTVYSAIPEMGGGAHLDLIHELDYAYWMFGTPERVSSTLRSSSSLEIKSVDYAAFQLLYRDFTANVVLNYYRRDYKRTLEVVTNERTLTIDLAGNTVKDHTGTVYFEGDKSFLSTYKRQMQNFFDLMAGKNAIQNNFLDGVEVLKIALYES